MRPERTVIPEREVVSVPDRVGYEVYAARLLSKCVIVASAGCWMWTGAINRGGYGHMKFEGRFSGAHRVSYATFVGNIPTGYVVCHACDNPGCINPDHLWVGTTRDNIGDAITKGRFATGVNHGEKNGGAKLTAADVIAIRSEPKRYGSGRRLAAQYGVNEASICEIRAGRRWVST